jgi:hypothetical protein
MFHTRDTVWRAELSFRAADGLCYVSDCMAVTRVPDLEAPTRKKMWQGWSIVAILR